MIKYHRKIEHSFLYQSIYREIFLKLFIKNYSIFSLFLVCPKYVSCILNQCHKHLHKKDVQSTRREFHNDKLDSVCKVVQISLRNEDIDDKRQSE
jgi:hypothetical protein